jgi:O-antigen ligase
MILVAAVPVGIAWATSCKSLFYRSLLLILTFTVIYAITLTGSRGGFIALAAAFFGLYLYRPTISSSALAGASLVLIAVLAPATYWERVQTIFTGTEQHGGSSINNRLLLQLKGVEIFAKNFVLGVGPGNFGQAFAGDSPGFSVDSNATGVEREFAVAHNLHLEFAAENGVIFAIFWVLLIAAVGRLLLRLSLSERRASGRKSSLPMEYAILVSLGSMLIAGLFLSQGKNQILWFLVGLAMGVSRYSRGEMRHMSELNAESRVEFRFKNLMH